MPLGKRQTDRRLLASYVQPVFVILESQAHNGRLSVQMQRADFRVSTLLRVGGKQDNRLLLHKGQNDGWYDTTRASGALRQQN